MTLMVGGLDELMRWNRALPEAEIPRADRCFNAPVDQP